MALPLHSETISAPLAPPTILSGGILWRQGDDGIEVCLARNGSSWSIPRGVVLEDERLEDAAVRHVQHLAGRTGRIQRRFERVTLAPGEYGYFFLLRIVGGGEQDLSAGCAWVPVTSAIRVVETEAECGMLLEALNVIEGRRSLLARRLLGTA